MNTELGKRIIDISGVLDAFEAQEGEVQHIIGATGQGKTYEATRRAALFLWSGYTVYTTWRLNLPKYYDEREHPWPVLRNFILRRRNYYRFDLQKNWHYVDLKSFDKDDGVFDTDKFARFLATRTDCIFMLDEGQDTFDSHSRAGKIARQSITRTRHMHKTLIIISQRAQAVDVNARANVTWFYKCQKIQFLWFRPFFKVYRSEEIDQASCFPIWERHDSTGRVVWKAPVWHKGFARKWVFDMYDSWYLRQQMIKSQDISLDAYELSFFERVRALFRVIRKGKPPLTEDNKIDITREIAETKAEIAAMPVDNSLDTFTENSSQSEDEPVTPFQERASETRTEQRAQDYGTLDLRKPRKLPLVKA